MTIKRKYFGTDGVRGRVGEYKINAETALKIGMAVGIKFANKPRACLQTTTSKESLPASLFDSFTQLQDENFCERIAPSNKNYSLESAHNNSEIKAGDLKTASNQQHRVVIGKDTRLSGYLIESALTAGLAAVGIDVFLVGPAPTPAIAMLTKSMRADIGIMISASHNPYFDNGIKIFDANGNKLNDEIELAIESMIDKDLSDYFAKDQKVGKVKRIDDAIGRYIEFVKNSLSRSQNFNNLKIVIDCANGASYKIAPLILEELGATVIAIGNKPNGLNINDNCGSTNTQLLQKQVLEHNADIGIALDGDADRIAIVDNLGNLIDGDKLIALIAEDMHNKGILKQDKVVITQMSNIALENYLNYIGITTIRVNIGDRYVLEGMKQNDCNFGAEQSGHVIIGDFSSTGDGMIAALQILSILQESSKTMSQLSDIFEPFPQILVNLKLQNQDNPLNKPDNIAFIERQQEILGSNGRILVRKSGTENLIRIMVEGNNKNEIENIANLIANKLQHLHS